LTLVAERREAAGEPEGALILLHGRATDEHDLFPFLDFLDPDRRLFGITPGAPLTDEPPGGRHWYRFMQVGYPEPDSWRETVANLSEFLDAELEQRGIAWDKTVLGGFSQGGVMSYSLGLDGGRPQPAGLLAMSCFIPTVEGWRPDLEARKTMPVMITHGELDPVISVEFAWRARYLLTEAGLPVTYLESRMPHTIDPRVVPQIQEWVGERTASPKGDA
jgi:phospholipase/carboxylesterase